MAEVANETWKNGYIDDGRVPRDNNWYGGRYGRVGSIDEMGK
jgi:hypothetical protein